MRRSTTKLSLPLATLLALATLAASARFARAQEEPNCTTTTTTRCTGLYAPYATPQAEVAPAPPPAQLAPPTMYPQYPAPAPIPLLPQQLRYEERPRYGLVAAGFSIFGAAWLLNATVGYLADEGTLAIPVVGPLVYLGKYHQHANYDCAVPLSRSGAGYSYGGCGGENSGDRVAYAMLVFDAAIQTVGVVMAGVGLFTKKRVAVYDRPRFTVLPTATPTSAGLAAIATF